MKVKELIERLERFDKELDVFLDAKYCDFEEYKLVEDLDEAIVKVTQEYNLYCLKLPDDIANAIYPEIKAMEAVIIS